MRKIRCCICNKEINVNEGRNPSPVKDIDSRCCKECDELIVQSARFLIDFDPDTLKMPDVEKIMRTVRMQLKKISRGDKTMHNELCEGFEHLYHLKTRHFISGQIDKAGNKAKIDELIYLVKFDESYVDMIYSSYSDGYDGLEFNDAIVITEQSGNEIHLGTRNQPNEKRINRAMRRATPELKKLAHGNKEMFNEFTDLVPSVFKDMDMLHREGSSYRIEGKSKLSYIDFVSRYDELSYGNGEEKLPWEYHLEFCKMMYRAWCEGYDSVMA